MRGFGGGNSVRGKKVEAEAEIDGCADNERLGAWTAMFATIENVRPFQRAHGIGFPEINTRTEPVVIIVAGRKWLARDETFADCLLASVIAENERGGEPMHVGSGTVRFSKLAALVEDALFDQHGARFFWMSRVLLAEALDGGNKVLKILIAHRALLLPDTTRLG